jgi:hypothetical protein
MPVLRSLRPVILVLLVLAALLGTVPALAAHKVYSPTVEPGEFELELRGHTTFDSDPAKDDFQKYKLEAGYGVAERWFSVLGTTLVKDGAGNSLQNEEWFWENIIQLTEQGRYWLDAGLYLELAVPNDSSAPKEIETKLLLEKTVGKFQHTANLVFVREVGNGAPSTTAFEYAWRSRYFVSPAIQPGIEIYGEMGEFGHVLPSDQQDHRAGPVLSGMLAAGRQGAKWKYEVGYLVGLSDAAPSGTLKFNLEYEFR